MVFVHMYLYIYFILFLFWFLISDLCVEISIYPSLRAPLCLDLKCTVFLCAPSCVVINQVMLLFWILVFFHTQPIYSYFVFLSTVSPAISRCAFLFEILRVFLFFFFFLLIEIYTFFRYFSFLFLSFKVKNHICIL